MFNQLFYSKTQSSNLITAAQEIVNDYDNYGEVLQAGTDGEYGPDSAIEILRKALNDLREPSQ